MSRSIGFEVKLPDSPTNAIERVTEALGAEGFGVLTRIDVKQTLKEKLDQDFRPYVILGACNPSLAHRALSADGRVGLLLPCNVTVEEARGGSLVRIGDPDLLLSVGDLEKNPELVTVGREARERLRRVVASLEGAVEPA